MPFLRQYETLLWALGISSLALLLGSLVAIPAVLAALPADYLRRPSDAPALPGSTPLRVLWLILKNIAGVLFLLSGLAMLVLPGQGVLAILIGLLLTSFPGKRRLVRRLLCCSSVLPRINWIRTRTGRPPLDPPPGD